jgi:hypothetical protein
VLAAVIVMGCVFNEDKKEEKAVDEGPDYLAEDYFPIKVGAIKEYSYFIEVPMISFDVLEYEKYEIVNNITQGDYTFNCIVSRGEGDYPDIEYSTGEPQLYYRISDNKISTVFSVNSLGPYYGLLADFDIPVGETEMIESFKDSGTLLYQKTVSHGDIVVVPAGVFENCIHIYTTFVLYDDGVASSNYNDYWFAKDIGLVKQVDTRSTDAYKGTRELVSYKP